MPAFDKAGIESVKKLTDETIPKAKESLVEVIDHFERTAQTILNGINMILDGTEINIKISIGKKP